MHNRLNAIFEEDIDMQDAIEDLDGLTDDSDDIIIGAIEDRMADNNAHLFTDETIEEQELKDDVDDLLDDSVDWDEADVDMDELLDDDDF